MHQNINSATRLVRILESTQTKGVHQQSLEVWANALAIEKLDTKKRNSKTFELVLSMNEELDSLRAQTKSLNIPSIVYESDLNQVENALDPILINSNWTSVRQYVTPEVLKSLNYLSHLLPDEESEISESDFSDLSEKIFELKCLLEDATITARLRKLIEHHIQLIEKAMAEYRVCGAKSLREAAHTGLGEMIESKDEFENAKGSKVATAFGELWSKVNKTTDAALKIEKVGQLANKAWDYINWIN